MLNKTMTSRFLSLSIVLAATVSATLAQNAAFKVGQQVTFDDFGGRYGGGRITGTVTKDRTFKLNHVSRHYQGRQSLLGLKRLHILGCYERISIANLAPQAIPGYGLN